MRFRNLAGVLALGLPLLFAHASATTPERFRIFSAPVKASMLLGKEVRNGDGEYLGTVGELVFDLGHNRTPRVVLDLQEGRPTYPLHALKLPRARDYVVLEAAGDRFEQDWDGARLVSAHRLIGGDFVTHGGAAAGKVIDVVLDAFWGNVAFAVVQLDGDPLLRAAPLDAFHVRQEHFFLRVGPGVLAALPGFTPEYLDAHVDDVDFLRRTARRAHQLTPLQ